MKRSDLGLSFVTALACASVLIAACVGDEPPLQATAPVADAGPGNDTGGPTNTTGANDGGGTSDAADAAAARPIIDRWSVTVAAFAGDVPTCVNAIDAAISGFGGGYTSAGGTSTFSRYGNRPGALLTATCLDGTLVTGAWAIKDAADTAKDQDRLAKRTANQLAPPPSSAVTNLPILRAEKKIHVASGTLPLATCRSRALKALNSVTDQAPVQDGRWSDTSGQNVTAVGVAGSTGAITCVGDTGHLVMELFSIDPDAPLTTIMNSLEAAFDAG